MSEQKKKLPEEYLGQPTFIHAQDKRLRAFNRIITWLNLYGKEGEATANQYLSIFPKDEKDTVGKIYNDIKTYGVHKVRVAILDGKHYA